MSREQYRPYQQPHDDPHGCTDRERERDPVSESCSRQNDPSGGRTDDTDQCTQHPGREESTKQFIRGRSHNRAARERIIGILLGNLVAYVTFVYVWPVTISRRVDPALATAFSQLAQGAAAQEPHERQLLASQAQGTLRQIEADIGLAQYEPPSIRRPSDWLAARREIVVDSQSLGVMLLSRQALPAQINERLQALEEALVPRGVAGTEATSNAHP